MLLKTLLGRLLVTLMIFAILQIGNKYVTCKVIISQSPKLALEARELHFIKTKLNRVEFSLIQRKPGMSQMCRPLYFLTHQLNCEKLKELLITLDFRQFL